jgi:hypothetical protein
VTFRGNPIPNERATTLETTKLRRRKIPFDRLLETKDIKPMIMHETLQLGAASLLPEPPDVIEQGFHLALCFPHLPLRTASVDLVTLVLVAFPRRDEPGAAGGESSAPSLGVSQLVGAEPPFGPAPADGDLGVPPAADGREEVPTSSRTGANETSASLADRAAASASLRRAAWASAACTFSLAWIKERASTGEPADGTKTTQLSAMTEERWESECRSRTEKSSVPLSVSRFRSAARRLALSSEVVADVAPLQPGALAHP